MNKAYERETEMWNQVFKECTPVDLRTLDLQVETMFDEALKLFAQKTTNVLDFGCGTGDISFQYLQYQPTHKVLGIDASKTGIEFATETAPSTKSGKPVCCSVSGLLCFFNPTFTRANASHAITFLSMQPHKTKQETRQGICIFPVQSLYDLSCFCISTFAQIFILLSALLQPSQQLLLYLLLLQSLLRSPPVHLKPCVPLRYLQLLRVPSD